MFELNDLFSNKIRIHGEDDSLEKQTKLFDLGFSWASGSKKPFCELPTHAKAMNRFYAPTYKNEKWILIHADRTISVTKSKAKGAAMVRFEAINSI